jgi:hypothetical protein
MLAMVLTVEVQITKFVMSCVLPSVKVPVAVSCCWDPIAIEGLAGVILIVDKPVRVPVPDKLLTCGLLGASSVTLTAPDLVPKPVGLNVTEITQVEAFANVAGANGQFEVAAKSPVVPMPAMVRGVGWLFFSVMFLAELLLFKRWPA